MDARLRNKWPNPPPFWALSAKSAAKTSPKSTQTLAGQCIAIPPKLPQERGGGKPTPSTSPYWGAEDTNHARRL